MGLETGSERLRKILDALPVIFAFVGKDGSVQWANRAFRKLFDPSRRSAAVPDIGSILPEDSGELRVLIRDALETGQGRYGIPVRVMTPDSVSHTLKVDMVPGEWVDGGDGIIFSATDITDLAELDSLKKIAYEQIEQNIEQLAILGDQIRNPLTVIAGLCDLLDDPAVAEKIRFQALGIDRTVTEIDRGWIESEKVRSMLRKYYDVGVSGTHELVARAIHEEYLAQQRTAGKPAGSALSVRPWNELDRNLVESNLRQADDIWRKLGRIHCGIGIMVDARAPPFEFTGEEIELLAVQEHERWVQEKLHNGWRKEPVIDAEKKLHDCLVPWEQLPDEQKEKDRNTIRTLPAILAKVRLKIVRLEGTADGSGAKRA